MSFPIQQGLFKYDLTDHYAILGLPLNADSKQIRQRYLKIAYRLHPDTCKDKTEKGKKLANQLLSKLVNPAYKELSTDQSRHEYLMILGQMGRVLATDLSSITLVTETAQKLSKANQNTDLVYLKLINPLVAEQYNDLNQVFPKTAQLSELNLVYLIMQQGQETPAQPKPTVKTSPKPPKVESPAKEPETQPSVSPVDSSIRRAQEHLDRKNSSQAIIELREALKTEPNNCVCHGLLGLAYLQEKQLTMAKVHINKAWKVNRQNPVVIQAKQALDQITGDDNQSKSPEKSTGGGLFSSLFGKKK